jgi:hypothetical protein
MLQEDTMVYSPIQPLGVDGAFRILDDPHMRRLITAMSLCDIQDTDIDLIVNARYNYNYAPEDVQMFVRYFADFKDFKYADRQVFVDAEKDKDNKRTYKYALSGDKNMLLWKLGLAPDKSFDAMMRDIATDSYYFFKERMKDHLEDEAQKWAMLFLKAQERVEKLNDVEDEKKSLYAEIIWQIQATKAADVIVAPEDVELEFPIELAMQSHGEILSSDQLQQLISTDYATIESKESEDSKTDSE